MELKEVVEKRREAYKELDNENLKIVISLSTPVAVIGYLPLDGILAYAVMKDIFGGNFYNLPDKLDGSSLIDVPLPVQDNISDNGLKYWSASFGVFEGVESTSSWKKRWDEKNDDMVDFGKKQHKVNHKSGWMKAYDMPLVIHSVPEVIFYAKCNRAETERLLKLVTHLGKKKAQGYGRIKKIGICPHDNDLSRFSSGWPARSIPIEKNSFTNEGHPVMYTGHRPPYWVPENQTLCIVP